MGGLKKKTLEKILTSPFPWAFIRNLQFENEYVNQTNRFPDSSCIMRENNPANAYIKHSVERNWTSKDIHFFQWQTWVVSNKRLELHHLGEIEGKSILKDLWTNLWCLIIRKDFKLFIKWANWLLLLGRNFVNE